MFRTLLAGMVVMLAGCGSGPVGTPAAPTVVTLAPAPPGPLPGPPVPAVTFDIKFVADPACTTLPPVARTRSYSADGIAAASVITLRNATFGGSSLPGYPNLWNVIYQRTSTDAAKWWFQDPEIWELLGAGSYVTIYGDADHIGLTPGTFEPTARDWPFWGRFTYCAELEPDNYPECAVPEVTCESRDHRLVLVKR